MSAVVVRPNAVVEKDATEKRLVQFDWDTDGNLADGVTISASTFTIIVVRPTSEIVAGLTKDNPSILAGSRKTQVRLLEGTLGSRYKLTNHITTNESPAQEKERSCFIQVVDQ